MTDVIIYTLDLQTIGIIIISVPILVFISTWIYYSVRDNWMKRDYKLLHKMNEEIEKYQQNRWNIEEDIERAKLLLGRERD